MVVILYLIICLQEFPLGRYNNKKDLKDAVKKMAYMERGTMTGQALRYLLDSSFSIGQGARPGVAKVGIVFTDGRSQDYIGDAAKKAKEHGEEELKIQYSGIFPFCFKTNSLWLPLHFRLCLFMSFTCTRSDTCTHFLDV